MLTDQQQRRHIPVRGCQALTEDVGAVLRPPPPPQQRDASFSGRSFEPSIAIGVARSPAIHGRDAATSFPPELE